MRRSASHLFASLSAHVITTCLTTVIATGWMFVVMATYMRTYRYSSLPCRILQRYCVPWVNRPRLAKLALALLALLFLISTIRHLLRDSEVVLVLNPGFPVIVANDETYPSVLEIDVTGRLPPELQKDVANRYKQHLVTNQKGPLKLLSVSPRQPSCHAIIKGDKDEIDYSLHYMEQSKQSRYPVSSYPKTVSECEDFLTSRGYITYARQEEKEFPIAYSIMMYRDADQAERLLRAIYRPTNYYCIHVDAKADKDIQEAMRGISGCFKNVFLASKQNIVDWAQFNSLEPWIYCMRDLWRYSWKYFINLTGQEFPLKTNLQIIKILKALNGSNVVDTTTYGHYSRRWYENMPPPHNIQPYKGLVFMLASRGYVDYILHNPVASELLEWVRHTDFPDESYFSTLNHNPHLKVPGSYKGNPETNAISKPFIARFVNWGVGWLDSQGRYPFSWPCGGKRVRRVCIFGVHDLELLVNRRELFANKLIIDFQPTALDCLEEWHLNMTLVEYAGKLAIDTTWYKNLDIVRNKVL
ncbi:beta-1,3-galactosyl-O-glycosyl-glycoprotein beta-1,6-N-acetylglucosaminyltransferase-like [Physella acuta]|uniref:beta-1,3-galactosyl-O-glycosyl-glycoprotein beta-1,6-N-acetylglucosaminyltransferase-like n=1 Tax=Physella acuta TaxID=109671 RepID=UPI0027DD70FA|nr:beta-1,3-galactosyl-O-glycosyl-glycoprotein beta-1,6-N-acetylglucosaminyltransferase-like [Physella acuta]